MPLSELHDNNKVIGTKQVRKAINKGQAKKVYLANDAEPHITGPLMELCQQNNIEVDASWSMKALGETCGIEVGSAAVALIIE